MNHAYISSFFGFSLPFWAEVSALWVLGLVLGSFISALTYRLPRGKSWVRDRSHCPHCGKPLSLSSLVPLFSFLWQKGRCAHCHTVISWRYPLIELASALMLVGHYLLWQDITTWLYFSMLSLVLLAMLVVDLEEMYLPDGLQLSTFLLGVLFHLQTMGPIAPYLATAMGAGATGLFLRYGYYSLRKTHGLGLGDVKFFTVAGLWLGWEWMGFFFFLSGVLGVLFGLVWQRVKQGPVFPFGPALILALIACLIFKQHGLFGPMFYLP